MPIQSMAAGLLNARSIGVRPTERRATTRTSLEILCEEIGDTINRPRLGVRVELRVETVSTRLAKL